MEDVLGGDVRKQPAPSRKPKTRVPQVETRTY